MKTKAREVWMWEAGGEQFPETASRHPISCLKRLVALIEHECNKSEASEFLLGGRFVKVTLGVDHGQGAAKLAGLVPPGGEGDNAGS